MTYLNFNETEINTLANTARERKFSVDKINLFYSKNPIDKMWNFINSYRFLLALNAEIEKTNKDIYIKIKDCLNYYKNLFDALSLLSIHLSSEIHYGQSAYENKIKHILINKQYDINYLIDTVFPIGKIVSMYDPDSSAGYV